MIGLCFEAETTCSSCGKPLPMNALAQNIVCTECMKTNTFSVKDWKDLLADMFKEGPTYAENEGTPSTIMGSRTYKIMYGRQNPKFLDTKTYMNVDEIIKFTTAGKIINPETNIAYSIRPITEDMKEACPNVTHLICEDFTQLPSYSGPSEVLEAVVHGGLIPFTCPSCAGTLQIDGSERLFKCQFCATESYIPDETWQKLHPVKTKQRFYFWFDEKKLKFDWDSNVYDVVADTYGTLYISLKPTFFSDDDLWVVALNPDLTIKWKRNDLKFKTHTSGGEAKLGLTLNGELMVWSKDRNAMLILSSADGSEIKRIGKKCEETEKIEMPVLDFTRCLYIAADIDGNYFAYINREKRDSDSNYFYEFMKVDKDATIHNPWDSEENQSKGFFGSLKKAFSGMSEAPYFDKLSDKATRCKDSEMIINVGQDGSYYFRHYDSMVKYNRSGKKIYFKEFKDGSIYHNIIGDRDGYAYFIFKSNNSEKYQLMKISPDGSNVTTFIKSVIDGGFMSEEDLLAISANGTIYCLGYSGCIRTFSADGNLIYASPQSLEDEADKKKEIAEMED